MAFYGEIDSRSIVYGTDTTLATGIQGPDDTEEKKKKKDDDSQEKPAIPTSDFPKPGSDEAMDEGSVYGRGGH